LHIFERSDGEGTGEVRLHGSSVGMGERGKAKQALHGTRFVCKEHTINLRAGKNVSMIVACGGSIHPMASHVALIDCRRAWKMGANERWC
jgi:hypothetical protein